MREAFKQEVLTHFYPEVILSNQVPFLAEVVAGRLSGACMNFQESGRLGPRIRLRVQILGCIDLWSRASW